MSGTLAASHPYVRSSDTAPGVTGWNAELAGEAVTGYGDPGGASRFFYTVRDDPLNGLPRFRYEAKAPTEERPRVNGISHPTTKPLDLMRWLLRLVCPPNGTILDPFLGSGTTAEAALLEGFRCIGIEREADYLPLIEARLSRQRDPVRAIELAGDDPGLFAWLHEEGTA
jgi:site-specific DNA-methyltransferase (adenine-specific)